MCLYPHSEKYLVILKGKWMIITRAIKWVCIATVIKLKVPNWVDSKCWELDVTELSVSTGSQKMAFLETLAAARLTTRVSPPITSGKKPLGQNFQAFERFSEAELQTIISLRNTVQSCELTVRFHVCSARKRHCHRSVFAVTCVTGRDIPIQY